MQIIVNVIRDLKAANLLKRSLITSGTSLTKTIAYKHITDVQFFLFHRFYNWEVVNCILCSFCKVQCTIYYWFF